MSTSLATERGSGFIQPGKAQDSYTTLGRISDRGAPTLPFWRRGTNGTNLGAGPGQNRGAAYTPTSAAYLGAMRKGGGKRGIKARFILAPVSQHFDDVQHDSDIGCGDLKAPTSPLAG